jgi:hypothetical protein
MPGSLFTLELDEALAICAMVALDRRSRRPSATPSGARSWLRRVASSSVPRTKLRRGV